MRSHPVSIVAAQAPPRKTASNYPEPFASRMGGRTKRALGDLFGLKAFGVNLTRLSPGAVSALHHRHSRQDEFVYVVEGELTLLAGSDATVLGPGMAAGFPANGDAHHLENRTLQDCVYLEIGDRAAGDEVSYPDDDMQAVMGTDGKWSYTRKDGVPY